jgi:sensor histidine kinase regulating citrate/malate metabolism
MENAGVLIGAVLGIIVAVIVARVIREILCWYWKINECRDLLVEQNKTLMSIHDELVAARTQGPTLKAAVNRL